jgi:hypothetical protein
MKSHMFVLTTLLLIANKKNKFEIYSVVFCLRILQKSASFDLKNSEISQNISAHKFCVLSHITNDSSTSDFLIATTFSVFMSNSME